MAVSTTNAISGPLLANGSTTVFPFTFTAPTADEVQVVLRDSDGVDSTVSPSAYTVALTSGGGGAVTFATAPASGNSVYILLNPDFTQEIEFENGSAWLAAPVNEGYDRSAARDQVLKRDMDRGLKFPVGETPDTLPVSDNRLGKYLAFDAAGDISMSSGTGADAGLRDDMAASSGAALVGFLQSGSGATDRTALAKLRDTVSVEDFGATGDGTTNDGAAINLALATGKDVLIQQGKTYNIDGVTLLPSSNQRIYGGGRLLKSTTANDLTPAGAQDGPKFFKIDTLSNVVIDGIEMQYTGLVSPRVYGLTIETSSNCKVTNCRFLDQVTPCFIWKNSDGTVYENNYSEGGNFGIAVGGDGAGNTNGAVTNTIIRGNYISGAISEGVDLNWDTQGCLVEGNCIVGNNTTANEDDIDVGGGTSFGIVIRGNYIDSGGNSTNGVIVKLNTTEVLIEGNTFLGGRDDTTSRAIYITGNDGTVPVTGVQVRGNIIREFNRGISLRNGCEAVTVEGNDVADPRGQADGRGIEVYGVSATNSNTIKNVVIVGNRLDGNSTATSRGIFLDAVDDITVTGNKIKNFLGDGVTSLATNTVFEGNTIHTNGGFGINFTGDRTTITGNIIYNNGQSAASDGIALAGADYALVQGNTIFDNQGTKTQRYGINVSSPADRCIINGNILTGNNTGATNGTGTLTNSLVGAAGNITA